MIRISSCRSKPIWLGFPDDDPPGEDHACEDPGGGGKGVILLDMQECA
jgi:hypothetical protein